MAESIRRELMVLVERVVRPLPVPLERQKRLRAEFLGHLQAIHAEEIAKDGDEAASLLRTAERFGDPSQLTAELRRTVPWWSRYKSWLELALAQRPNESITHFAVRMIVRFALLVMILFGAVLADKYAFAPQQMTAIKLRSALGATACVVVWLSGFLLFGMHLGREWLESKRQWMRIALCVLGLIVTWPASVSAMTLIALGTWSNDAMPPIIAVVGGLFCAVVGTAVGILHRRDTLYRNEWAGLDLQSM